MSVSNPRARVYMSEQNIYSEIISTQPLSSPHLCDRLRVPSSPATHRTSRLQKNMREREQNRQSKSHVHRGESPPFCLCPDRASPRQDIDRLGTNDAVMLRQRQR